ncbi:MAG: chemotaxis protein CheA [Deltaproteobacteria bacterium]|nr:chemotaxis protein CheA [Deltaproteobacteria bacterium]
MEFVDGISEKALGEFLSEAQEIVENLNRDILKLDDNLKRGFNDPDLINNIFRFAHSLKGLSGMFGAKSMADFSHHLENVLDALRLGRVRLTAEVVDVLFEGTELFNRLIAEAGDGPLVPEEHVAQMIARVDHAANLAAAGEQSNPLDQVDLDPALLSVLTEYEEFRLIDNIRRGSKLVKVHASFDLMSFDEGLAQLTADLKAIGEVITTLPSSSSIIDGGIEFDILLGSQHDAKIIEDKLSDPGLVVGDVESRGEAVVDPVDMPGPALASVQVDAPQEGKPKEEELYSLRSVSQTVRVEIDKLDRLMNIVGELVLARTSIQDLSEQLKSEKGFSGLAVDLYKAARNLERRLDELQTGIMEVRMVPLSQSFEKLSRMIRKLSRSAGKSIELKIRGADTELDKLIVEDLADPLMHIMRNAFDHGIEMPEERARVGKSTTGIINVHAYQKGKHVVIEIADDGRGIDFDRLREKARSIESQDLPPVDEMTKRDLLSLLFLPGFSTSDGVSELSGRGVGLDVVKTNIANLSGMIDVHSEVDRGTKFTITLPITLAIIRVLIIHVLERNYAIPLSSVLEIVNIHSVDIHTIARREVVELRGQTLPLLRLNSAFDLGPSPEDDAGQVYVVVVGLAENRLGVLVDGLVGQQDIVIKSLGRSLSQVPGIAGATTLASQETILVLDVAALFSETLTRD